MFICEICGNTHYNEKSELCNVCVKNSKAAKKEVTEKHADSKLKLADLLSKAKRKHGNDIDVTESLAVVKMGNELFSTKVTKAKLLALITANSNASRSVNNQLNK